MDPAYILALIRFAELGSAWRVVAVVYLFDGGQIGKVVHLPVQGLADALEVSYGRAKALRARAVKHRAIEMVGRQSVRRTPASVWHRTGLHPDPIRDPLPIPNGPASRSQGGTGSRSTGLHPDPIVNGSELGPLAGSEVGPLACPKAVKGSQKIKRQTAPAAPTPTANVKSAASASTAETDCLLNSEGGTAKAKEGNDTTKRRLQRWSYGAARVACKHLSLDDTDANGIASELRRLAKKHRDGLDDGMRSAAALLEELTVNAESTFAEGGAVVGALRNRWPEWSQPGGTVPTWIPPEPLPPDPEPEPAEQRVRAAIPDAISIGDGLATIDDVMKLAEEEEEPPPAEGEPKDARTQEEAAIIAELREYASEHPCESPSESDTPSRYARESKNHLVCFWRHPDGRESLQLIGQGRTCAKPWTQKRWARIAWPELSWDALDVDEVAPAATMTTREAVG